MLKTFAVQGFSASLEYQRSVAPLPPQKDGKIIMGGLSPATTSESPCMGMLMPWISKSVPKSVLGFFPLSSRDLRIHY